jgi:hypothetical protein
MSGFPGVKLTIFKIGEQVKYFSDMPTLEQRSLRFQSALSLKAHFLNNPGPLYHVSESSGYLLTLLIKS